MRPYESTDAPEGVVTFWRVRSLFSIRRVSFESDSEQRHRDAGETDPEGSGDEEERHAY
jgi:hypothetical protein